MSETRHNLPRFGDANLAAYRKARRKVLRSKRLFETLYTERQNYRYEKTLRALFPVATVVLCKNQYQVILGYSYNRRVLCLVPITEADSGRLRRHPRHGLYYQWPEGGCVVESVHWEELLAEQPTTSLTTPEFLAALTLVGRTEVQG